MKRCDERGLLIELTPSRRHKGVGRAEKNNDILTRSAEAMLLRSRAGQQWLLAARAYAQWILNRVVVRPSGQTRFQRYLNKIPDLHARTPYLSWSLVAIIDDVLGPKGSQAAPRGSIGHLVGISGASYLDYRLGRGVVHQAAVQVLDEVALLRAGLLKGLATAEAGSLMLCDAAPPPPTDPLSQPAAAAEPPTITIPTGSRIKVLWRFKGVETEAHYLGTVVDSKLQKNGIPAALRRVRRRRRRTLAQLRLG